MSCAVQRPELVIDNIFVRPSFLRAGEVMPGHAHNFAHATFIDGHVVVRKILPDGSVAETEARSHRIDPEQDTPPIVRIEAGVEHELTAVVDSWIYCIYAHRTPLGEVTETYTGWPSAYV